MAGASILLKEPSALKLALQVYRQLLYNAFSTGAKEYAYLKIAQFARVSSPNTFFQTRSRQ